MIRLLLQKDIQVWLELAAEVEPLFGPMTGSPEFRAGIGECIRNGDAYGFENEDGKMTGIIAVDRNRNEILWLAVGKEHRGNRYGEKLLQKAIAELKINGDIYVQTFSGAVEAGRAARILYERNGFADWKESGPNPAGIDTVIMIRKERGKADSRK